MIIDADTHISPYQDDEYCITIEELIRRLDRAQVDKALTWLRPPYIREVDESNAYVYEATRRYPDRIIGFGWADPKLGIQKAKDTIKRCVYEYGFYGVKLNGAQIDYNIDDERLSMPCIEELARTGKVMATHVGADAFERSHPFRIAKVARRFPELHILAAHMGGVGWADLTSAMIEFAKEVTNVTLIGSAVRTGPILKAIQELGASRVCFGSDAPFEPIHVEVARYNAMLDGEVSAADKEKIMWGNIAGILGLSL